MHYTWDANPTSIAVDPASANVLGTPLEPGHYAISANVAFHVSQGASAEAATTSAKRVPPNTSYPVYVPSGRSATKGYVSVIGVSGGATGTAQIVRENPAYPLPA